MLVGLRIVAGVVVYRLKKLEMANLAAAGAIALALHLPPMEIAFRVLFAFGLNVLVYLNNDYIDIELDLHSSDKDAKKASFLAQHLRAALWAQVVLGAILSLVAVLYDVGLLFPVIVGGGI